jgi:hypothetical protein
LGSPVDLGLCAFRCRDRACLLHHSLALAIFAQRRRDLVFKPIFWLFATFILLCGATHLLDVVTLWVPAYGAQVVVKAATALVSIGTAIALWQLLP